MDNKIFVFGSNLAGRHGKGAALEALRSYGARYGVGIGPQGRAYAIPTKDKGLRTLELPIIARFVREFIAYTQAHPELSFFVTAIGTGLAGYSHAQIAPMFRGCPKNCQLPQEWKELVS